MCCRLNVHGDSSVPSSIKVFQVDSTDQITTNATTWQILHTTAAQTKIKNGENWKINWSVHVCHPGNTSGLNTMVRFLGETSPNVFAALDNFQVDWPIIILSLNSSPAHLTIDYTAVMDDPRFRFEVQLDAASASSTLVENPRVGGVIIPA